VDGGWGRNGWKAKHLSRETPAGQDGVQVPMVPKSRPLGSQSVRSSDEASVMDVERRERRRWTAAPQQPAELYPVLMLQAKDTGATGLRTFVKPLLVVAGCANETGYRRCRACVSVFGLTRRTPDPACDVIVWPLCGKPPTESRMREIRTYGLEGGEVELNRPLLPYHCRERPDCLY
jgi:hypothetical protein